MSKETLPKGFVCPCGEKHKFTAWVYDHWQEPLTFTCPKCGKKAAIRSGVVTLSGKEAEPLFEATP